jgi:phosphate transport system substrate-binding protein
MEAAIILLLLTVPLAIGLSLFARLSKRKSDKWAVSLSIGIILLFYNLFSTILGGRSMDVFGGMYLQVVQGIGWILFLICLFIIWTRLPKAANAAVLSLLSVGLICVIVIPAGLQIYSKDFMTIPDSEEISADQYHPFAEETLAAELDEPSTLVFTEHLPRLDGATALYPVYASFVRATYPEELFWTSGEYFDRSDGKRSYSYSFEYTPIECSKTEYAFNNLLDGDADIVFLMGVSENQRQEAEEEGLELKLTPIGKEAFVFMVNSQNPVDNLTQDEIRGIYSGKITDWGDTGTGENRGKIDPFQRQEESGSQTKLQEIMGDVPLMEPSFTKLVPGMPLMYEVVADYKNFETAIGYSFRYYIETMLNDAEKGQVKLLAVDGVKPTAQTIADGSYPFAGAFYAVTVTNRADVEDLTDAELQRMANAERLIDWILTDQGQSLVEKTGYVSIIN